MTFKFEEMLPVGEDAWLQPGSFHGNLTISMFKGHVTYSIPMSQGRFNMNGRPEFRGADVVFSS